MIVVDTNIVAYLLIGGQFTELAQQALLRDKDWIAPPLWRHEFLNVLATSVRENHLDESRAMVVLADAPVYMRAIDHERPLEAMRLSAQTRIATYDCEFVVLARRLLLRFVTKDRALLKTFGDVAVSLEDFAAGK